MIANSGTSTRMRVLGAMSGTSLDGIDWAVLDTDGEAILGFGDTGYRVYTDAERDVLRAGFGQWSGTAVAAASTLTTHTHIDALRSVGGIGLIGFHGQTLNHDPATRRTLQVGDGAALARATGVPVAWDFRSRDVAQGGQGAPLAPFYHFACAKYIRATGPVAFLNLGGVGNITYVDPRFDRPEENGALLAFDTGPANAPINDGMAARFGRTHDANGTIAASGKADMGCVEQFLAHPYFAQPAPKSLDRNAFDAEVALTQALSDADAIATLTHYAVAAVARAMDLLPARPEVLYLCGGGRLNPTLVAGLVTAMPCKVTPIETVGLDGDMLEAQAFAFLAARVARGLPISAPMTTGVSEPLSGGILSRP